MLALGSGSGGKDSCLALYKALQSGIQIKSLVNFISKQHKRVSFHGTEASLIRLQAECIGLPIYQKENSPDMKLYEKEFKEAVSSLKGKDVEGMVFGDIYLDEHRDWVERVCGDLGLKAIEPLWNRPTTEIIREFISAGFKSYVVAGQADKFGPDFMGRLVDEDFLAEMQERGICPCGENGEFHTLVCDGPLFEKRIEITEAEPVLKDGFCKMWFWDTRRYRVVEKSAVGTS